MLRAIGFISSRDCDRSSVLHLRLIYYIGAVVVFIFSFDVATFSFSVVLVLKRQYYCPLRKCH